MKDRENDGSLGNRIFVGGLSWDVTERQFEDAFDRYGKISECQIMIEKDTGRPRGFGFITFTDRRGADDAIKHMHGKVLGDKIISVNKAEPKVSGDDVDHFHKGGGYSSRGRGAPAAEDECFKCGRPGHWAQECPSTGGDRGRFRDPVPMRSTIGEFNGHKDRYGDRELERERGCYIDERRDGGRYNDRDKYGTRDFYQVERYDAPAYRDRLVSDYRYGMPDHRHLEDDYGERERSYDRDRYGRGRASDRYGAMEGRREYRSRPGPYDRPSRGADDAIKHMHGKELGDKIISVNKAEPKVGGEDVDHFHKGGGYSSRGRGAPAAEDECFKCGRPGHWARECPSTGGDRGRFRDPVPMRSRIGEFNGHKDRYGDRELERERGRYIDERRDGGRYNDRDKYETRDFYPVERYDAPAYRNRLVSDDRYGMPDHRHLEDDYGEREISYDRDRYGKGRASDRYGAMEGRREYRSRPGPYDRPSRGADNAIKHMHGKELGDKIISVNKAEPKVGGEDVDHFHKGGGYSSRGRGAPAAEDECFKCGRPGHWARECPSTGGDQGRFRDPVPMRSRIG